MVGEGDAAVRTLGHEAALRALERAGVTAPVQEEHRLLAAFEALGDGLLEFLREDGRALFLPRGLPHVHDADDGHLLVVGAELEFEQRVFAALDVVEALHRRRRGAEHDHGVVHLPAHDGDIARVVARGFLLFVGMLVLFIHDDEAERLDGREDGRARADDDARAALPNLVPLVVALAGAEVRVQHGDLRLKRPVAEAGLEALDRLRRERNLWHEHDGSLPLRQRVCDALEIDFGLPRAGDAVEEKSSR